MCRQKLERRARYRKSRSAYCCLSLTSSQLCDRIYKHISSSGTQCPIYSAASLGLFVCGISLTSGQLFNELFRDCTRSCFSQVISCRRGSDRIYEMRCLFLALGLNAHFIVLPHWDNMRTMQAVTTPIFKRLWYDWTQQQPGIEPTNPLGQCWVQPIVAFYDQQGLLRTYSLPGSSIRSPHSGSPREVPICSNGTQCPLYSAASLG